MEPIKKKRNISKILLKITVIVLILLSLKGLFILKKELTKKKVNYLESIVQNEFKNASGEYGIVIKNLKTGESYNYNEHHLFQSASLYKLWVMATAFKQIKEGRLKEEETISDDIENINERFNIASEEAELTEGSVSFTVLSALKQMITISHNYAALLLSEKVGIANVINFLKLNGFDESSIGNSQTLPMTTPHDMALFFEKLYNNELNDGLNTTRMFSLLRQQKLNNKLPLYLPRSVVIAHKTGELNEYSHDAGIIYAKNGDYIIVIMTKTTNPLEAEDRIARVSKKIYEYFTQVDK